MVTGRLLEMLLVLAGSVSLAIGVVGIFLPLLPTTPFLLLAAACYLRGSRRMYDWLMRSRWLGEYIRGYREGRGIPLKAKVLTLAILWATIAYSVLMVLKVGWTRILLLFIAAAVSYHIISIRTLREEQKRERNPVNERESGASGAREAGKV